MQRILGLFAESAATLRGRCGKDMTDVIQLDGRKTNPRAGCLAHGVRGHSEFLHVSTTANGKKTDGRNNRSLTGTEESRRFTRAATPCPAPPRMWCPGGDPTYEMLSIGGGRRSPPETARHERFQVVSYVQESRIPPPRGQTTRGIRD